MNRPCCFLACVSLVAVAALLSACSPTRDLGGHVAGETKRRTGQAARLKAQSGEPSWPNGVPHSGALSQEQAVAVALWNNADFQSALADLGLARGEVIKAGQLPNPTLAVLFPLGPKQLEFATKFPLEALVLRPQRVAAANCDYDAVAEKLIQGGLGLARDVKYACAAVALVREKLRLAREASGIFDKMSEVAKARQRAGDTGELETAQANAEALLAVQEVARLEHEERLALDRARTLTGLAMAGGVFDLKTPPMPSRALRSERALVREATAARPDMRAAELAIEAAGKRAGLAKAEILQISGLYDANGSGSTFESGPGLEVTVPIFNQNQGARAIADARVAKSVRDAVAVRDRIAGEVRQARTRVAAARAVAAGWERTLPELQKVLERARTAVELGNSPQLIALDAARRLVETRSKAVETTARLREAWAELEYAVGHRL